MIENTSNQYKEFIEAHKFELMLDMFEVVKLIGYSEDQNDCYYVVYSLKRGEVHSSCVGKLIPLKDVIPENDYKYLMRVFDLNTPTPQIVQDDIISALNAMIQACEPIKFDDFNKILKEKEKDALGSVERKDSRIGIRTVEYNNPSSGWATSTAAIIATITDICVGKRLAFQLEHGFIIGVQWYKGE